MIFSTQGWEGTSMGGRVYSERGCWGTDLTAEGAADAVLYSLANRAISIKIGGLRPNFERPRKTVKGVLEVQTTGGALSSRLCLSVEPNEPSGSKLEANLVFWPNFRGQWKGFLWSVDYWRWSRQLMRICTVSGLAKCTLCLQIGGQLGFETQFGRTKKNNSFWPPLSLFPDKSNYQPVLDLIQPD